MGQSIGGPHKGSFADKIAIVTGGASGIGRALCEELGVRGSTVVVADIVSESARSVAEAIRRTGGRASAATVDVSDAEGVGRLIDDVVADHQRLDYLFNNAGTSVVGDARDLGLDHWRRVMNVNLWGAIHGTTAAYTVMVAQGDGHIVNTASLAGLVPSPISIPYSTTKHALVGLSLSLRAQAADLGIRVSVVCPGFVRSGFFEDVVVLNAPRRDIVAKIPFPLMDTSRAAREILRGVERNRAVIVFPGYARLVWRLYRLNASLLGFLGAKAVRDFRRLRTETPLGRDITGDVGP
jgi:NAD(P)-dependent dehydrogenase (short-subunit alcohol dehydrogenase family)